MVSLTHPLLKSTPEDERPHEVTPALPKGVFPPTGLTLSGVACWWSIMKLIQEAPFGPCYFWRISTPDCIPDYHFGIRHAKFVAYVSGDIKAGHLPKTAGVRIFEPHPGNSAMFRHVDGGHGLHAHWILSGRLPIKRLQMRATQCCLGYLWVDPETAGMGLAHYMAKYLVKSRNMPMPNVRRWANIFGWKGMRTKDVEISSKSIEVFRTAHREAKAAGRTKGQAYINARVAQQQYDLSD